MKKILLGLFSLILLGLVLVFGSLGIESFKEIGGKGGELIMGKMVITDFIQNNFSLPIFVISLLLCICFLILFLILLSSLLKRNKEDKNAVVV